MYQMQLRMRDQRQAAAYGGSLDQEVLLPGLFCPDCLWGRYPHCTEADDILVNEIPEALYSILKKYEEVSIDGDSLLPEDFAAMAQEVRVLLSIPTRYKIRWRQHIGVPYFVANKIPTDWEFIGGRPALDFYLTARAAELLDQSGLTGFDLYPVEVYDRRMRYRPDYTVYQLIVYGNGGVPRTEPEGFWYCCHRCGNWQLSKYQSYQLGIDPDQWDGSDFFRFVGYGPVLVTERAKKWLEGLGSGLWVKFVQPDWRYYVDTPSLDATKEERWRQWREQFGFSQED